MKLSEAKIIVGKMIQWTMLSQGIPLKGKPDQITEDLQTLLKANAMVKRSNDLKGKRMDKELQKNGKTRSYSMPMTIADRGIAALYVAANFAPDQPDEAEVLAMHNESVVFCLSKNSLSNEEGE